MDISNTKDGWKRHLFFVESQILVSIQFITPNITDVNSNIISTDSNEALSKLKSAGLNHHFPKLDFFHGPLLCWVI